MCEDLLKQKLVDRLGFLRVWVEGEEVQEFFQDSQVNELAVKLEEDYLAQGPDDVVCTLYFIFVCAAIWLAQDCLDDL